MRIGVPRETKDHEYRVGLTPDGARQLVRGGHEVCVERGAGIGSGFGDPLYEAVDARLVDTDAGRRSSPICTWRRTAPLPRRCSRAAPRRSATRRSSSRTGPSRCSPR
jgi:alanine dehydrogenase